MERLGLFTAVEMTPGQEIVCNRQAIPAARSVSRAVDLGGGCEEIERSGILNNCGNNTI
jgi:hypothetical protein